MEMPIGLMRRCDRVVDVVLVKLDDTSIASCWREASPRVYNKLDTGIWCRCAPRVTMQCSPCQKLSSINVKIIQAVLGEACYNSRQFLLHF